MVGRRLVYSHLCHWMHVEFRGQLSGVSCFLRPRGKVSLPVSATLWAVQASRSLDSRLGIPSDYRIARITAVHHHTWLLSMGLNPGHLAFPASAFTRRAVLLALPNL